MVFGLVQEKGNRGGGAAKPEAGPMIRRDALRDRVPFYTSQEGAAKEKAEASEFPPPAVSEGVATRIPS